MSSAKCCFLTFIQVSQEAGQVVWYSHLLKNFAQFIVIPTVKGFGIVNKAEIDTFLELSSFLMIQWMLAIWSLILLPFLKPAWTSGSSPFSYCWILAWKILSIILPVCEMSAIVQWFEHSLTLPFCGSGKTFLSLVTERLFLNYTKMSGFLASRGEQFNLGQEMRLDRSELLCNKVLLKYKADRESFWHRHQKGAERVPPC